MDSSSYQQNNPSDGNNDPSRNNSPSDDNNDPSRNNNNGEESSKKNDDSSSKKGKGRKKIPMEKIKSDMNRQVTFSKRRIGVFKKASELHTLCGADNAVIVFSPSGKTYSFAAPNMQTITKQFLNQTGLGGGGGTSSSRFNNQQQQMHVDNPIIRQRNAELADLERQLADEKRKKKEHARTRKVKMNEIDYPPNIDLLDMNQLQALKDSLLGLKNALATTVNCGGGVGPAGPMDPNILQGPPPPSQNNNINMDNHQFYYGNNGAMLINDDIGPFVPDQDVLNNNYDQTLFDFNVNNSVNNNANGGAAFVPPGMVTNNQKGYFDQTANNNSPWSNYETMFDFGVNNNVNNNASGGAALLPGMVTNNQYGYFDQTMTNKNSAAYHQFPPRPNDHEAGGSSSLMFLNDEEEVLPSQDAGEGKDAGEARPDGGANGYGSGFNNNYNNFGF